MEPRKVMQAKLLTSGSATPSCLRSLACYCLSPCCPGFAVKAKSGRISSFHSNTQRSTAHTPEPLCAPFRKSYFPYSIIGASRGAPCCNHTIWKLARRLRIQPLFFARLAPNRGELPMYSLHAGPRMVDTGKTQPITHLYKFQVVLKPAPPDILELYSAHCGARLSQ
jgi:hypothetical protein